MRQAFKLIAGSSIERPCADANNSILRQKSILSFLPLVEMTKRLIEVWMEAYQGFVIFCRRRVS